MNSFEDLFRRSQTAIHSGDLLSAAALLRLAFATDPDSALALTWLANVERKLGNFVAAREAANLLIKMHITGTAYTVLGQCDLDEHLYREAETWFRRAIQVEPEAAHNYNNLALALERQSKLEEAANSYRAALKLEPNAIPTRISFAQLLLRLGRRKEAVQEFETSARLDSNRGRGLIQRSRVALISDDPIKAKALASEAVGLDPNSTSARRLLASSLQQLGEFQEAKAIYSKLGDVRSLFEMVHCGPVQSGDSIIDVLQARLPQKFPKDQMLVHYALGKGFDDMAEPERAINHFREANRIAKSLIAVPFDPEAYERNVDEIIRTFTLEFFKDNSSPENLGGRSIYVVGMIRSGTTLLERQLTRFPGVFSGGEIPYWTDYARELLFEKGSELAAGYQDLIREISEDGVVVDKMPLNFTSLGVIHSLDPTSKIVHITRDPKDTLLSIYLTAHPEPLNWGHDWGNIELFYRQYLRFMKHWRAVLSPDIFLEIAYEDLVTQPERTLETLSHFLAIKEPMSEASQTAISTPSKWQARQPIHRGSVGRWERYAPWLPVMGPFNP